MRRDKSKGSLSIKLKRAGWDDERRLPPQRSQRLGGGMSHMRLPCRFAESGFGFFEQFRAVS
jgi:hypothetical protein